MHRLVRTRAIDLLAAVLDLPEEDRVLLRGWHERSHAAIYRVAEVSAVGTDEELLETVNEINGQVYRVRMGIDLAVEAVPSGNACPGQPRPVAAGRLVLVMAFSESSRCPLMNSPRCAENSGKTENSPTAIAAIWSRRRGNTRRSNIRHSWNITERISSCFPTVPPQRPPRASA